MNTPVLDIVTVVPAYKPAYLADLLNSLRLQTRRSRQIIFSDDSPNGEYRAALFSEQYAQLREGLDIEFHEGPRLGGYPNVMQLVEIWNQRSALLHVMLDDDVIYPEFYERHLVAHAAGNFSCSISRRWTASETGHPIDGQGVPAAVAQNPNRMLSLDEGVVFLSTAAECKNWFGEFSNAVFRAPTVPVLMKPVFAGVSYAGLWDLGAFMAASRIAPIAYVQDHLGYFRTGGQGNSGKFFGPYMKAGHLAYAALALGGQRLGVYTDAQARKCYATIAFAVGQRYGTQDDMQAFLPLLQSMADGVDGADAAFVDVWHAYLRQHNF